ncbi:HD-GYP domain, c-di-GMP phosphodiesterase class II (or its inactivated variant) [Nitrosomonas aestuarii]|uniref:HD-GYP domain, c-di-GMP phosphodiesterase class II (Or its inactivated variant) n=1 Tax=Nitrosomonas aestuarii TaxID=52441 RepID=A0A1I4DTE3_9PROT|nr:HD-GYP domain-containing protein [Nitrosomonas aestuarii]SFK96844.1 HD-GYP domain, c-di-GMP phosphodiesterase class II (or its inactivated variant) [Nitrosomonas aestuarii]
MLKKIGINDIRLGMYIHKIGGDWMEHPFWTNSFLLSEQKDLHKLKNSKVKELWIDSDKGLDVMKPVTSDRAQPNKQTDQPVLVVTKKIIKIPVEEELQTAKKIHAKTKEAVTAMFNEVRMGKAVRVEEAVVLVDEINHSMARNANAMLSLIRLKTADEYTYLHSVAVCVLMIALGKQLGLQGAALKQVGVAGLLHDIGKMVIPGKVLNKPGKLTEDEFAIVKNHPRRGWEILKTVFQVNEPALDVCLHHHERMDGKGYPEKLSANNLTLYARMGSICDVYDAISSERCYKKGWEPAEAIKKMAEWKGGHFDETVFHAFVKTIGIYPIGTLLKLKSDRLGIVIEQSEKSLVMPVVKVFFSLHSNCHIPFEIVDLSESTDSVVSAENPQQWGLDLEKIYLILHQLRDDKFG